MSVPSLSETTVFEPHFQVKHRRVTKETRLELPKRDSKELPGWAMHVPSATRRRNQVMNFKFRSASAAMELELREGAGTPATQRQKTHFQTQKEQSKKTKIQTELISL